MCVAGHDEALLDEMLKEAEKHSRFLKLFVYLYNHISPPIN